MESSVRSESLFAQTLQPRTADLVIDVVLHHVAIRRIRVFMSPLYQFSIE